ncbi:MAG TPA: hypothetical protein VGN26_21950, partial [Armatimonadota bacterium]
LFGYALRVTDPTDGKGTDPSYRIVRPQASREEQARLALADLAEFRKRSEAWVEWGLLDEERTSAFYKAHPELTRDVSGLTANTSGYFPRLGLFLSDMTPEQWSLFVRGGQVTRSLQDIRPGPRGLLQDHLCADLGRRLRRGAGPSDPASQAPLPREALRNAWFRISSEPELADADRSIDVCLAGIDLSSLADAQPLGVGVGSPYTVRYTFGGRGSEGECGGGVVSYKDLEARRNERQSLGVQTSPPQDTMLDLLASSIGAGPDDGCKLPEVLRAIHRAAPAPIVADFHARCGAPFGQARGATLGDAIDWCQVAFAASWRLIEGIHTLRDRRWYADDAIEVPADRLRGWRAAAERIGSYTIPVLTELCQLSDVSINRTLNYGLLPGLQPSQLPAERRAALRLLAALSSEQASAAASSGLPTEWVNATQKDLMAAIWPISVGSPGQIHAEEADGRVVLTYRGNGLPDLKVQVTPIVWPKVPGTNERDAPQPVDWITTCPHEPKSTVPSGGPAGH